MIKKAEKFKHTEQTFNFSFLDESFKIFKNAIYIYNDDPDNLTSDYINHSLSNLFVNIITFFEVGYKNLLRNAIKEHSYPLDDLLSTKDVSDISLKLSHFRELAFKDISIGDLIVEYFNFQFFEGDVQKVFSLSKDKNFQGKTFFNFITILTQSSFIYSLLMFYFEKYEEHLELFKNVNLFDFIFLIVHTYDINQKPDFESEHRKMLDLVVFDSTIEEKAWYKLIENIKIIELPNLYKSNSVLSFLSKSKKYRNDFIHHGKYLSNELIDFEDDDDLVNLNDYCTIIAILSEASVITRLE